MTSRIMANGIEVNYELEGPAGAPVIMLSNSFLTDYGMWDFQIPAFTRKYRVLRYDSRGHGDTEASPGPYSIDLLVADAVALLDALDIRRVHFLGLSMGGMIAQKLAASHADRIFSATLSDTACRLPPESAWDDRIKLAQTKGASAFVKPMTERWLTQAYRERHPEIVDKFGAMISRTSVDGVVGCAEAIKKMDQSAILSGITVPILIVVGEQDFGTPVSAAKFLHHEIKGSKLVIIKEAAHLPNIEQTEIFNRTVLDFIASCSTVRS
jgi:3-oxoadipate enol-lactonase